MYFKNLKVISNTIIIIITIILNVNCSMLKNISIHHDITQGHHLNAQEIQKICIGMNKNEILYNIGSPTLQDLFESNIWYYIFYHQKHNKIIEQQTVILKFNKNDILINIQHHCT